MTENFVVKTKLYEPSDARLGRHVRHDSRSLSYQVEPEDLSTLRSIRHARYIPTLDQGNLGSCTGNASVGCLGTGIFWSEAEVTNVLSPTDAQVDETYAIGVYAEATTLDDYRGTYPPTDTGSDGLAVAQVLKSRGLISGYEHATSLEAALTALAKQPVIVGTEWRSNMFDPDPDGRLDISGSVEGGHEYMLDELDVENQRVWMHNSWGDGWGIDGRAYLTWDDLRTLLRAEGDCTVFTPLSIPAPQPTPPTPVDDPKAEFVKAAQTWASLELRTSANRKFQAALRKFLAWYA